MRAGNREGPTCLLATCETWVSTTALPPLLRRAGVQVTGLSPWPLRLSGHVRENLAAPRDPAEAAHRVRTVLRERNFDWVIIADDALLRALVEGGDRRDLAGWFPVNPFDEDALAFVLSKHAFTERAPQFGIPVPEFVFATTAHAAAGQAQAIGFPVVVKGPHGFGGLEVHVASNASEVIAASATLIERYGRVVVQRLIGGVNAGACVVYDRGVPLGFKAYVAQCAYPTPNSASTVHELFSHRSIEPIVRAIGAATGFHGMLGVDFMYEAQTDSLWAIEVNPRPTLGFAGAAANVEFFTPVLTRFFNGSGRELPTVRYDGPARLQAYFRGISSTHCGRAVSATA